MSAELPNLKNDLIGQFSCRIGGEFGFGAEVGISTDRLHARGPMGIRELTTWKFEIVGQGQVRG